MKGKREGRGVIGRQVRVKGMRGIWKVTAVGGLRGADGYGTIQVSRESKGRVWILGANRRWVKFVRHNYEVKA